MAKSGNANPVALKAALNASRGAYRQGLSTAVKSKVVATGGAALRAGGQAAKKSGQIISKTLKHADGQAAMQSTTMAVLNTGLSGYKTWETHSIEIENGGITRIEACNSLVGVADVINGFTSTYTRRGRSWL